jgi:hypothetical protein
VKGGRRRSGAVRGSAVCRENRSRPWEEPDPPSLNTPTSSTSRCHRLRLPPRRRTAPPHFTDACTTARCHQGEDDHFPALVDAPAFEPKGNVPSLRSAAPPLVMPAFVPGWVNSFAGAAAFVDARSLSGLAYFSRSHTPCRATRVRDAALCRSRSRSRSHA